MAGGAPTIERGRGTPGEAAAGVAHQPPERHVGWAGGLAPLTLDALVDDPLERGDAGAARHCTSRMAVMRPRGLAASSPVTRYVGQWGRHNPHWTHAASSSSSTSRGPRSPARESACAACVARIAERVRSCGQGIGRPGFRRPVGSNACLTRRLSSATAGATALAGAGCGRCTVPTPTSATN